MPEAKSETIELWVNGEPLAEFIVDHLAIEVTRYQVLIRGACRDTYADKVLLNPAVLKKRSGYRDISDIPEPQRPWWRHLWVALGGSDA